MALRNINSVADTTNIRFFPDRVGNVPKVSAEYRDARRSQILDAARRCFLRDGFHETSMQDLFNEVGLSSGAVYGYFNSKEDVILAVAEESLNEVISMIHPFVAAHRGEGLGNALGDALEVLERKHKQDQRGAMAVVGWAEALRNPELAKRAMALMAPMRADLAELVREHQASGDLPQHPPPEALAAVLMSIVSGFLLQLALFDPLAEGAFVEAVRALWPASTPTGDNARAAQLDVTDQVSIDAAAQRIDNDSDVSTCS
jgi:AcrR family transcriptional regulator